MIILTMKLVHWIAGPAINVAIGIVLLSTPTWAAGEFEAGNEAYAKRDYETAFNAWLPLAKAGDPQAQNNIGFMYRKGRGVPASHVEAVKWYRRAAEQGFAEAMTNLGFMLDEGFGVKQDFVESYKWFLIASRQGRTGAEGHLEVLREFLTAEEIAKAEQRADSWTPEPEN